MDDYDIWVDFMRMRDDGSLRTRVRHARDGFVPIVGSYVVVGSEDAESSVARIIAVDIDGAIDLQVLPGPVDDHLALLSTTG